MIIISSIKSKHVQSPVKRSRIYINSKFRGYNRYKFEAGKGGDVLVRVTAKGFRDFRKSVKVKEGETLTVRSVMIRSKLLDRINWVSRAGAPISAAPVYYGDRIISCTENGKIIVMSSSGRTIVSKSLSKGFKSKPVVYKNNAFAVDVDGVFFSVNIVTGKLNWKVNTGGPLLFKSGPLVIDGKIFLATGYGNVMAYSLKGEKIWNNNLDEAVYNSIQYYKGRLLIATDALKIYALDAGDGDELWSRDIDGRVITLSPQVYKDILFFGCYSGKFYALDVDDGDPIWTFQSGGSIYSTALIRKGILFFGSDDGNLYALSHAQGKVLWKFNAGKPLKHSPISAFGNIFITDKDTIYALNPENGSLKWKNKFNGTIKTSPSVAGNMLILGLVNGDVVSVRNNLVQSVK